MSKPLYDRIGIGYDFSRKPDKEITRRLYHHLQVFDQQEVIDVACGSGNYTCALHDMDVCISGVDISTEMLAAAKEKGEHIQWYEADVVSMPFENNTFSGAVCILAIHHFDDLVSSFREVYRIIKPGSRFVIFTSTPEQMQLYWLNEYFPEMMHKAAQQMPDMTKVNRALECGGFHILGVESFLIQPNLEDFFLYSGKFRPELYLNREVRKGISSFAALSSPQEVQWGTEKLQADLNSGEFSKIARKYVSKSGDYLFVVSEKPEKFR